MTIVTVIIRITDDIILIKEVIEPYIRAVKQKLGSGLLSLKLSVQGSLQHESIEVADAVRRVHDIKSHIRILADKINHVCIDRLLYLRLFFRTKAGIRRNGHIFSVIGLQNIVKSTVSFPGRIFIHSSARCVRQRHAHVGKNTMIKNGFIK